MKSTLFSKNTTSRNSAFRKVLHLKKTLPAQFFLFSLLFLLGALSSCSPTYPARTLCSQLTKLIQEEQKLNVTCHISGKTLWVYIPLTDLIKKKELGWNEAGGEKMNTVMNSVRRVVLSTDAALNFVAIVAADVKTYGVQLINIEYVPDIRSAILENFSRGEFSERAVKDIQVDPSSINDLTGESKKYYDITFDHFIGLQIIQRIKNIFYKDKTLRKLFEIKSASQSEKFGIIKIDFEFMKKRYDVSPQEEKIKPIDYVQMVAALVVKNYAYKDFQAIELTDTFANQSVRLTRQQLGAVKVNLPEFLD